MTCRILYATCRIWFPNQGIPNQGWYLGLPLWDGIVLATGSPVKSFIHIFYEKCFLKNTVVMCLSRITWKPLLKLFSSMDYNFKNWNLKWKIFLQRWNLVLSFSTLSPIPHLIFWEYLKWGLFFQKLQQDFKSFEPLVYHLFFFLRAVKCIFWRKQPPFGITGTFSVRLCSFQLTGKGNNSSKAQRVHTLYFANHKMIWKGCSWGRVFMADIPAVVLETECLLPLKHQAGRCVSFLPRGLKKQLRHPSSE